MPNASYELRKAPSHPNAQRQVVLADARGEAEPQAGTGGWRGARGPPLPKGVAAVGAFVMPNAPIDPRVPLSAYVVPLDDLEQVSLYYLFVKSSSALQCCAVVTL
jgi:hypothetical protein